MTNAYWDAVRAHVKPEPIWGGDGVELGHLTDRHELASRYSWTITDPNTVAFAAAHAGPKLLDPMAGSGWWAHVLTAENVDVVATDLHPAVVGKTNPWHRHGSHHSVLAADGTESATVHGPGRTLLLAWPPYDEPIGGDILRAFTGDRVIYIGEGHGGCCGNDDMFDQLGKDWTVTAEHRPVQWFGIHDYVTVYDRR